MFRKVLIFAMIATAAGYCWASDTGEQVVTSEVFYDTQRDVVENTQTQHTQGQYATESVWPAVGSDADVTVSCDTNDAGCTQKSDNNIRIVSKIGDDVVIENNFTTGGRALGGWSGGANMLHGGQVPVGFDDECASGAAMPLMRREMLEDDGGEILTVSRSNRSRCFGGEKIEDYSYMMQKNVSDVSKDDEFGVDESADAESPAAVKDQVRSWVVTNGETLRQVLQNWCDKEGWDLVWATSREYPIEASAVFKGRFVDVSSALVRNFGRATPIPYAKFYKGNRVLVISTTEE